MGLDRDRLRYFIRKVDEELATLTSRYHDLMIGGGAAIALLWDERRITNDIDVVSEGMTPQLQEAIRRVEVDSQELEPGWFNDAAKVAAPQLEMKDPSLVFDGTRLRLYAAPAKYVLAMKLFAARAVDRQDILILIENSGIQSKEELYDLLEEGYGRFLLRPDISYRIEELWEMHSRGQEMEDQSDLA